MVRAQGVLKSPDYSDFDNIITLLNAFGYVQLPRRSVDIPGGLAVHFHTGDAPQPPVEPQQVSALRFFEMKLLSVGDPSAVKRETLLRPTQRAGSDALLGNNIRFHVIGRQDDGGREMPTERKERIRVGTNFDITFSVTH